MTSRPRLGGTAARKLTLTVLARDYDAGLGYTPCAHCGARATEADHFPVSRVDGAPDTPDACVSACRPCNASRGLATMLGRRIPPAPSRPW